MPVVAIFILIIMLFPIGAFSGGSFIQHVFHSFFLPLSSLLHVSDVGRW